MDKHRIAQKLADLEKKMADQAKQLADKVSAEEILELGVPKPPPIRGQEAIDGLKNALGNFMTRDEVRAEVLKELAELNAVQKIDLVKDGVTVETLPEEIRHYLFPKILQTVNAGIPVALVGPAGSGKSTTCEQIAKSLGLQFYLQNGVMGEHQLTGYTDAHGKYVTTTFRQAFENGGFFMLDECDTSDAGALKWTNTAIAQRYASFPDKAELVHCHKDFRVVMAANTFGTGSDRLYVGANQLDASTLDRFVFFDFNYDEKMEQILSGNLDWARRVQRLRQGALKEKARVVISPRASINGAKLLTLGFSREEVEKSTIWKGIDQELKDRILKAANDNSDAPVQVGFFARKEAA